MASAFSFFMVPLSKTGGRFSASMGCSVFSPKLSFFWGVVLFDVLLLDDVLGGGVTKPTPLISPLSGVLWGLEIDPSELTYHEYEPP